MSSTWVTTITTDYEYDDKGLLIREVSTEREVEEQVEAPVTTSRGLTYVWPKDLARQRSMDAHPAGKGRLQSWQQDTLPGMEDLEDEAFVESIDALLGEFPPLPGNVIPFPRRGGDDDAA